MIKFVHMLSSRTKSLEEILGVGKSSKTMKGNGYTSKPFNSKTMFVTPTQKIEFIMYGYKLQQPTKHLD